MAYIWPMVLVVASNVVYQICAKSVPSKINPFASLVVTYSVGAITALIFYFVLNRNANLIEEYSKLNWASIVLGISVVGLEAGFIYAYKAGWEVSVLSIVQSAFLTIALIFIGVLFYKEAITWNKVVGILICLVGLFFINK